MHEQSEKMRAFCKTFLQMDGKWACGLQNHSLPHSLAAECKANAPDWLKNEMRHFIFLPLCVCRMQIMLTEQPTKQMNASNATHKLHNTQICQKSEANHSQNEAQAPRHKMRSRVGSGGAHKVPNQSLWYQNEVRERKCGASKHACESARKEKSTHS